jgi:hypothetical protein
MGTTDWKFLLNENVGRSLAEELTRRDYYAEVVDVLGPRVADYTEILPYTHENDLVIVTKDYPDFSDTSSDDTGEQSSSLDTIIRLPTWRLESRFSSIPTPRGIFSGGVKNSLTSGFLRPCLHRRQPEGSSNCWRGRYQVRFASEHERA